MAIEYRKYKLSPGQQVPLIGENTSITLKDGSMVWIGQKGTFPEDINSSLLTEDEKYEFEWRKDYDEARVYGTPVEDKGLTPLEKLKLRKIKALKNEARMWLGWEIGDFGDNITDTVRALVLARCIAIDYEKDPETILMFDEYCKSMYDGYGGGKAIMDTLMSVAQSFATHIGARYYLAKSQVEAAATLNGVEDVTLPKVE